MLMAGLRCTVSHAIVCKDCIQRFGNIDLRLETINDLSETCILDLEAVQKLLDMSCHNKLGDACGDCVSCQSAAAKVNNEAC